MFVPSLYQKAIFDWVESPRERHGIVNAVAGSGKSKTLEEAVKSHIPPRDPLTMDWLKILMMSFNVHIAEAMSARMPKYVWSRTFNSFGWYICRQNVPTVTLKKNKTRSILANYVPPEMDRARYNRLRPPIERMVSLLKALGEPNIERWREHAKFYGIEFEEVKTADRFEETLEFVYKTSVDLVELMDYDDQVFQVIHRGWELPRFKWVLIDETQDSSPVQMTFAERLAGYGRLLLVGDPDQCQPSGSMVTVVTRSGALEERPIEAVQKWDSVVSLVPGTREWRINPVLETATRPYSGELIVVKTSDGRASRYTLNHRCIADFSALRNEWCVYLMARGSRFRVGMSAMAREASGNASYGLAARMRAEGADRGWILSLHGTQHEAWVTEQIVSIRFNLPQTVFKVGNKSIIVQSHLNEIWDAVGDNTALAEQALLAHGRLLEYPLIEDPDLKSHALKRLMRVRACNLVTGCNLVTLDWHPRQKHETVHNRAVYRDYRQVTVTREHYEGNVYSLRIARDETYVSDGLACSNSIYLFRGAHPDAMGTLAKTLDAKVLPLSTCYRCSEAVIECAQEEVPRITSPEINLIGKGSVEHVTTAEFIRDVADGDLVLCRTTAPLIRRCLQLLSMNRKAYVLGRDLVEQVIQLVETIHGDPKELQAQAVMYRHTNQVPNFGMPMRLFLEKISNYKAEQTSMLIAQQRDDELQSLEDRVDGLLSFAGCSRFIAEIILRVEDITSDESQDGVGFMTGHKAKGLEAERGKTTWLLRWDLTPHRKAKTDAQIKQEFNLRYVMKTRARENLRIVEKERDEK